MPQLDPEFFLSQLFWLVVFFSFLLLFLWRVSLPRIAKVLEKRQNTIDENLTSAKELQEQALEIESNINKQLNKAKQDTDAQIKETIMSLQDDVTSKLVKLDKDLEDKILKSEKEIIKNRDNEIKNIDKEILNITKITISKITNIDISDNEINSIIKSQKEALN
tara:strand:- start:523 stop:1014 length:492 start_codon:yes stop_codon:yes gene_type:complete